VKEVVQKKRFKSGSEMVPKTFSYANSNELGRVSFPLSLGDRASKRILDIVGASIGLLILSPLLVSIYFSIMAFSPGNPIFVQSRWGRGCKLIKVFKFRTMHIDQCDVSGVSQTVLGDQRVTRLGSILRRFNLDELPQLFNVLRGDMSLVGPRCHVPNMLAGGMPYEDLVSDYHKRHAVKPGITGLAQVRGLRGPTTNSFLARRRVSSDLEYIENWTIWLDIEIIMKTVFQECKRASGF
jgi:lipopolysaccharide/colanic/teichoic acid biosynthesis glycosyltransferase